MDATTKAGHGREHRAPREGNELKEKLGKFGLMFDLPPSRPPLEKLEALAEAMRDAGATLMEDENFRPHILEPLEVYGVDAFEPGQIVVKARIKTVPLKQWTVGRELRKRIASMFRERGIKVPRPQVMVVEQPASRRGKPGERDAAADEDEA